MSAKTVSSLTDENRDLRKQIGCMNGIFQIFDRHQFLTGRRISSHSNKRLLQGAKNQPNQQYAEKAAMGKGLEMQKEKPRISTESSRASFSSSSCSSTFSSLDYNRTAQPETVPLRKINIPEIPFEITATRERRPSLTKDTQSHDLRDVVKDSMYREVRRLSIKTIGNDERRGTVMKHIDSPRPLQQSTSGKPKATGNVGSPRVLAQVQEGTKHSKDQRLALPRFSYDGRESREVYKSAMKHKELPRLSLDSKTGSVKAFESRLKFLGRYLPVENEYSSQVFPLNQEPGSHNRTSSVVAKLMGLDPFPDTISTDRTPTSKSCSRETFLSQLTSTAEESKQNRVDYSPRVSQSNPASPSPKLHSANFVRKPTTCSRFPVEPAPWRQQDSSQVSPKKASKSRKAPTNALHHTPSVYGEIMKRIPELQFKESGKDLRALKQTLEAMQKTREHLEDQRAESAEFTLPRRCSLESSCSDQNSNLSMWKNKETYQQVPSIQSPRTPKQLCSAVIMKPAKAMDKVKLPVSPRAPTMEISHLRRLQTQTPEYHRGSSAHSQKANNLRPENDNIKYASRHFSSTDKKTRSISEPVRTLAGPQCIESENFTTPGRSSGAVSPRLKQNLLRIEGQCHPTTPPSDSGRIKKHCSKKLIEKVSQNRKNKVKAKDRRLSDDQLSELSCETRYSGYQGDTASVKSESNNSLVSQTETEIISLAHSIHTTTQQKENSMSTTAEHMAAVESAITMLEQPSPISVLDNAFYCEDSPSPIKKISTVFRDESPSPDEADWHLETLNHLTYKTRSNHSCEDNPKLENMKDSVHALTLLKNEPDGTAANHSGSPNPVHKYINKILLTSGLLKDSSFISTTDELRSSHHLINPDMFDVLEQTEEIREVVNGGVTEKNDSMNLNKRIQREIIFDMVDEILVRTVTSGRLFTVGKRGTSPQELLKEVYSEVDRMCRKPDCSIDEEDEMIRLLTADMMYQSEDWVSYSGEAPALVLDIERLIFKDLINEIVTGEVTHLRDWPKRHCKKLFSK